MRFMLLFKGDPSAETPPPADRVAEVVAAMREYGEDPARAGDRSGQLARSLDSGRSCCGVGRSPRLTQQIPITASDRYLTYQSR